MVVVVVVVLHLHRVNKGWQLFFSLRVKFDEDRLVNRSSENFTFSARVFSWAVATALIIKVSNHFGAILPARLG